MFTALQPIGAENNGRALANPVGSFERGDALIAIALFFGGMVPPSFIFLSGSRRFVTKYGYTLPLFPGSCHGGEERNVCFLFSVAFRLSYSILNLAEPYKKENGFFIR